MSPEQKEAAARNALLHNAPEKNLCGNSYNKRFVRQLPSFLLHEALCIDQTFISSLDFSSTALSISLILLSVAF